MWMRVDLINILLVRMAGHKIVAQVQYKGTMHGEFFLPPYSPELNPIEHF